MIDHKALVEPVLAALGPGSWTRRYEEAHVINKEAGYYTRSGQAQHLVEDVALYFNTHNIEHTPTDLLTVATLVSRRIHTEG